VKYGFGALATSLSYRLQKMGLAKFKIFNPKGRRIDLQYYAAPERQSTVGR
jgi:hypothetical protein